MECGIWCKCLGGLTLQIESGLDTFFCLYRTHNSHLIRRGDAFCFFKWKKCLTRKKRERPLHILRPWFGPFLTTSCTFVLFFLTHLSTSQPLLMVMILSACKNPWSVEFFQCVSVIRDGAIISASSAKG